MSPPSIRGPSTDQPTVSPTDRTTEGLRVEVASPSGAADLSTAATPSPPGGPSSSLASSPASTSTSPSRSGRPRRGGTPSPAATPAARLSSLVPGRPVPLADVSRRESENNSYSQGGLSRSQSMLTNACCNLRLLKKV